MNRYVFAWFPMVFIAVANGAFREAWLVPRMRDGAARRVSTLLLIALFSVYFAFVFSRWPIASLERAIHVGTIWLVLTLAFEFLLGRFASRLTWREMLAEYNVANGRLWILVPLWVAAAPYVFFRVAH